MQDMPKYLLVETQVLPEVFVKVVEAKMLIAQGKAKNSTKACEMVSLSRSTFYRYKDCVEIFDTESSGLFTLYLSLNDIPGVLSSVLHTLYQAGANVITINQSMPINSVAPVSISLRTDGASQDIFSTIDHLRGLDGVIEVKLVQANG